MKEILSSLHFLLFSQVEPYYLRTTELHSLLYIYVGHYSHHPRTTSDVVIDILPELGVEISIKTWIIDQNKEQLRP